MDYSAYYQAAPTGYIAYPPTPAHSGHSNDEYSGSGSPSVRKVPSTFHSFHPTFFYSSKLTLPASAVAAEDDSKLSPQPLNPVYDFPQYDPVVGGVSQVSMINGGALQPTAGPMLLDPMEHEQSRRARSSSEEKEPKQNVGFLYDDPESGSQKLTSAQRRKEQNRAAQRAFRERKERHVKELETQLSQLKSSSTNFQAENEALRQQLQKVQVENEILKASGPAAGKEGADVSVGPMSYTPTEFYANLLQPHTNKHPSHRITFSPTTGERLLGAGATWDLIYNHPLFQQGLVDPADVCDKLKSRARCDGQGPVFEESVIKRMIEESAGSGRDELI